MIRRVAICAALAAFLCALPSTAYAGPPRSFFGVAPQAPLSVDDLARMHKAGLGTLRTAFLWNQVDGGSQGAEPNWQSTDGIVIAAAEAHISLLPVLYGTPTWVAGLDGNACYPVCGAYAPQSPAAVAEWERFVGEVVDRYGPNGSFWDLHPELPRTPLRTWQIWNEQNSGQSFAPRPDVDAYGRMLEAAARAIRSRDPRADIVLGGMFGNPGAGAYPGYTSWSYLHRLYGVRRIERWFDTVAIHPYSSSISGMSDQVRRIREQMAGAHDDARIWITEIGWASGGVRHPLNKGMRGQATYLTKAFRYFLSHRHAWRISGVNWFSWRDAQGEFLCEWCPQSGLFPEGTGFTGKPSFRALLRLTGGS
ncbi:MAG: glycosyl hydrolase [Solirubrobacterales bacterium]